MVRLCGFVCAKPMVDREDTIKQGGKRMKKKGQLLHGSQTTFSFTYSVRRIIRRGPNVRKSGKTVHGGTKTKDTT